MLIHKIRSDFAFLTRISQMLYVFDIEKIMKYGAFSISL